MAHTPLEVRVVAVSANLVQSIMMTILPLNVHYVRGGIIAKGEPTRLLVLITHTVPQGVAGALNASVKLGSRVIHHRT